MPESVESRQTRFCKNRSSVAMHTSQPVAFPTLELQSTSTVSAPVGRGAERFQRVLPVDGEVRVEEAGDQPAVVR